MGLTLLCPPPALPCPAPSALQEVESQYKEGTLKHALVAVLKAVQPEALTVQGEAGSRAVHSASAILPASRAFMPLSTCAAQCRNSPCVLTVCFYCLQPSWTRPRRWASASLGTRRRTR